MAYWAATQLQAHRERVAEHFLQQFGFEVYLPRVRRHRIRWRRRIEYFTPYFPGYGFTRIKLQWHGVRECPGVIRLVRIGGDEPVHVPDEVIDALRKRERDGAIDLPYEKHRRKNPRIGDCVQVVSGPFAGQSGLCTQVSRQQIGVLLLMFKAQRQVRLRRDAVELV
jgi:transcription antitermination factor NusG